MHEYCYSPKPKEFYTIEIVGPGRLPLWLWNLYWLAFPFVDAWEVYDKTDYEVIWLADGKAGRILTGRAHHARNEDEDFRVVMKRLTRHPRDFLQAMEDCEYDVCQYLLDGLIPGDEDPEVWIRNRALLAAARIDDESLAAKAAKVTCREGNVIRVSFVQNDGQ